MNIIVLIFVLIFTLKGSDSKSNSWKNRVAPPTDQELTQIGLGNRLIPPNDVQVAVAMSKVGRKLIDSDSQSPISSPTKEVAANHTPSAHSHSPSSFSRPPTAQSNNYSLGQNLPNGVSWRYVNILENNHKEK